MLSKISALKTCTGPGKCFARDVGICTRGKCAKMCKKVLGCFLRVFLFSHMSGKFGRGFCRAGGCARCRRGSGGPGGSILAKMAKNGQKWPKWAPGPRGVKNGQKWAFWHGSRIFLKGAWMSSRTFPPDYTLIRIAARGVCTGNSHRFPACAGVGFPTGFPAPGPRVVQTCAHSCNTRTLRARAATPRTPSKTRRQGHGFLHAHVSAKLPRTVAPTVHQQLLHRVEQMHQPERRRAATAWPDCVNNYNVIL